MSAATASIRSFRRMPDFAGVALVDILANGVAMLIIVIVVTIAARMEREERYAEQADEVAAVMSHKFSTSLVLNSLAASPPARLHDYDTSPLDQVLDPDLLPILELHPRFVREFYSGTIWTRRDLLQERSGLDAWLAGLGEEQRRRLRIDVYDIPQFYLTMAILREYGIRVYHWHFLTGALSPREAARCPPGVAARHCQGSKTEAPGPLPQLALENRGAGGLGGLESPLFDPPWGAGGNDNPMPDGAGFVPGPMPGGVVPGMAGAGFEAHGGASGLPGTGLWPGTGMAGEDTGRGAGGTDPEAAGRQRGLLSIPEAIGRAREFGTAPGLDPETAAILGSFPGARERRMGSFTGDGPSRSGGNGRNESDQATGARETAGGDGPGVNLRIALPESLRREARAGGDGIAPALEEMFGVVLHYLGELQETLDAGGSPSPQIDSFAERIQRAFRAPPSITEAKRHVARDLALKFALLPHLGTHTVRPAPLALRPAPPGPRTDAALVVAPNRLNDVVGVSRGGERRDGGVQTMKDGASRRQGDGTRQGQMPPRVERRHGQRDDEGKATGRRSSGKEDGEERDDAPRDTERRADPPPGRGSRAALALNAYPGIWKGLEIRIEPYSVLLMPPQARESERMRWRAVAYVTPGLDDFIVGFVFADMDAEGRLRIQADANRVRLEGRALFTEYRESAFGSRGWLVSLYVALAAGLLLVAVGWRRLARIAGRTT